MSSPTLASVLALARERGINLEPDDDYTAVDSDGDYWHDGRMIPRFFSEFASMLALVRWLAERGVAVVKNGLGFWIKVDHHGNQEVIDGHLDDGYTSAVLAAADAEMRRTP